MVGVPAAVVDDLLANAFGYGGDLAQQLFDRFGFQRGMPLKGRVEVVHVSLVVLAVMNFHRHLVDCCFQGIGRIGQRRQSESHRCLLLIGVSPRPAFGRGATAFALILYATTSPSASVRRWNNSMRRCVIGPAAAAPMVRPSTRTTGANSPIVPVQNISSAR